MFIQNNLFRILFLLILITSCKNKSVDFSKVKEDDFLFQQMDSSVNPGDDFFRFATGKWMKDNPIPSSERRWGIDKLVRNSIYDQISQINSEAAKNTNATKGSNAQLIGDFWATGMDSTKIDLQGISSLKPQLDRIEKIKTIDELMDVIGEFQVYAGSPLFSPAIYQDAKNSEKFALYFYQGGIGLPDRDYYFNNDARTQNVRKEYKLHIQRMFTLLGDDSKKAAIKSSSIFKIETDLAAASRKIEDLRDPYANYNKMSIADFSALAPSINWKNMLDKIQIINIDSIIVGQPEFFKQVEKSLKSVPIEDWKTYLQWNLLSEFAENLGTAFDKENFSFFGTVLSGTTEQRPRWKRIMDQEESYLGDALGQLYVEKYVSKTMRTRYVQLVTNMLETYKDRIQKLDWMGDSTKAKAILKLSKINSKVCYPDKWKDYSKVDINRNSHLQNVINCRKWGFEYEVAKLYKPVDRTEWEMTPQTYNAYYNPSNNEIVLPAAQFLIPGLPDSLADDAIVYGYAAASTIGHELTHGFDDEGRQFDASGNLSNWWTTEDSLNFSKRAELLVRQFNDFVVLDSMHINGKATLGENMADLGGVVIGLEAFKKTEQYKKGEKTDGLTPVQRYFLGYTLGWLGHTRDASLAMQVMTNVHSPNFLRVNGPLSNVPEFYEAFGIKEGDKMWRADAVRVKIW